MDGFDRDDKVLPASEAVVKRLYDETLALLVEARNYLAFVEPRDRGRLGTVASLKTSCEALRMTARLTQVMAWLLTRRAVQAGEITAAEAAAHRLSARDVCLDDSLGDDPDLTPGLRSLMARSHRLYCRTARLDDMWAAGRRSG